MENYHCSGLNRTPRRGPSGSLALQPPGRLGVAIAARSLWPAGEDCHAQER